MKKVKCGRLYKYRSLAEPYGRESINRVLLYNKIYWQSPVSFNDPFDCNPVLYFGDNEQQRADFRSRAANYVYKDQPRAERRRQQRQMGRVPPAFFEDRLRNEWKTWLCESAISCFSEVHDHPLMWGHYADSHRGVCLIFDEIANDSLEWFAFPVHYQTTRPRVNLTRFNEPEIMMQALFLKSDDWSYEREQRMVEWRKPVGYRQFPERLLKGIILGAKISSEDEAFVRELLNKRPGLAVFRASLHDTEFKLNIKPG